MLLQVEIRDFAIIEHSIIDVENGFNVITGETGAGKSIVFDALSSIIGERTSKSVVRKGTEKAELKAVFLKTPTLATQLQERNISSTDDVVIVERIISANGRSIAKVNGSIQSIQVIKELCQDLIEICGQKAHLELLQEDKYLHLLDNYMDKEHLALLHTFKEQHRQYKQITKSIEELLSKEREQEQLLDLYRFQKNEIEEVNLKAGEDESLEEERKFLDSFEQISSSLTQTLHALANINDIYAAGDKLKNVARHDDKLKMFNERILSAFYELEDVRSEIDSYSSNIEYDEARLNEINYRLETIKQMKRKYGDTIEDILLHYEEVCQKLDVFDNKEEHLAKLRKEQNNLYNKLKDLAHRLHHHRLSIAQNLETNILKALRELCMPNAVFQFVVKETEELNEHGHSKVYILFNANKGEEPKALSKIASGGELSRVLLSIKIASNLSEEGKTIIFDEVDEGIGGEVGRHIGQKLYELGTQSQVIAISHLPQVAAKADYHFLIEKSVKQDRTISSVTKLTEARRVEEVARMIYGDEKNEITLKQAQEMLKK
ncbi:DNA repair protein RecN [Priestia filamentosa]|uniref:DNA repair protein RecN n=1 Tax=Priestia filamentosa TaxID=1402861 RepID=UPI00397810EA